jgi:hypothetical protein
MGSRFWAPQECVGKWGRNLWKYGLPTRVSGMFLQPTSECRSKGV